MTRIGNTVSILASGPSLLRANPVGDRVAVNFAARLVPGCEWVAFTDGWFLEKIDKAVAIPTIGIMTTSGLVHAVNSKFPHLKTVDDSRIQVSEWPCCSSHLAIVIADQIMGYREIHLYGFDMDGDRYATGEQHDVHEFRWPRERRYLNQLIHDLRLKGVNVIKH